MQTAQSMVVGSWHSNPVPRASAGICLAGADATGVTPMKTVSGVLLLLVVAIAACSSGLKITAADAGDAAFANADQATTAGDVVGAATNAESDSSSASPDAANAPGDAETSSADGGELGPQTGGPDAEPDASAERPGTDACIEPTEGGACVDDAVPCPRDPCLACSRWECSDGQWVLRWVCLWVC